MADWFGKTIRLTDGEFWAAFSGRESSSGKVVTIDSAMQLSAVWACVRLISETIATLPLGLYRRQADGGRESATNHSLYDLLHYQPNADMTAVQFWEAVVASMLLRGNAFVLKHTGTQARVVALELLLPNRVTMQRLENGDLEYIYQPTKGGTVKIPQGNMMHIAGFSFDGICGLSAVQYGANVFGAAAAAEGASGGTFKNGLLQTVAFSVDRDLKPHQREEFREYVKTISGAMNAGKSPVLERGVKAENIGIDPVDAQLLESRAFGVEEICRWFRVPPFMVGHSEKCVAAGEKVFTEQGPKNIEDVRPGERVWSWNGVGLELQPVHHAEQTGVRSVMTIRTRTRTIRVTDNHRVLVRRKVAAPRSGPGGYRAVAWVNEWIVAGEVTADDYLIGMNGPEFAGLDTAPNGRALTEEFMEFCGLYLAEGSMSSGHVSIARHKDASYMDSYRDGIKASFTRCSKGGSKKRKDRPIAPITLRELDRDTRFSSVHAVDELTVLGFKGTAHTKRVPGWVFSSSRAMRLAFLRGYLDGDGSVNAKGWIAWSSCNKELLEDIRHLCFLCGIPCGEVCEYVAEGEVVINGRKSQRGVMYQCWSYSARHNSEIGSHTPCYISRWSNNKSCTRVSPYDPDFKGRGPAGSRPGDGWEGEGVALMKIHSVERGQIEVPVYDLGVEGTQSFIVDGLVVHNSTSWGTGIEQQMLGFLSFSLRPWLTRIEQSVRKSLLKPGERNDLYAEFAIEGLLRADSAARADFYSKMTANGIYTRDDCRVRENLPRLGGNAAVLTVQSNMLPIDRLGESKDSATARDALLSWLGDSAK